MNCRFFNFPILRATLPTSKPGNCIKLYVCFFARQHIVEDERSDKEETDSEDEGTDHEQREKSLNGHVQNGHTVLNNNHSKKD